MAWTDQEDVNLAEMIKNKESDRKVYIERFGRTYADIQKHGQDYLGHDMSFVERGKTGPKTKEIKEKRFLPLLSQKRKYKKRGLKVKYDDITSGLRNTIDRGNKDDMKELAKKFIADPINPAHYKIGQINGMDVQSIDVFRAVLTPEEFRGFCKGSILKYVIREKRKNGDEDILKGKWYMDALVKGINT